MTCLLLLLSGCHRSMYREAADAEAYCLIGEKISRECWPIPDYTIEPSPESRMFDPSDRDFPPLPPDDPTSHQFMHQVDCHDGYGCWHINGDTSHVENPGWWQLLPLNEAGAVTIDSESAMRLALLHSPRYQGEQEDLYLSALDVSFQRFQFDTQYFGGFSSFFTTSGRDRAGSGGQSSSRFELNTFSGQGGNRLLKSKMSASGAELAIGLANSLVWELSGVDTHSASSLIDFSIVQPLLRGAGRDVVLEGLTQSERSLLANVRQMERFRREFYVEVIAGRNASGGPSRTGPTLGGDLIGSTSTSGTAGGYLGLLQTQQDIRNQRANISALQSSVAQLQAFFLAGRIDYFQVELARQALYSAQSRLLVSERNLQSSLDQFKLTLGLPPGTTLALAETLIEPFQLVDPEIVPLQDQITRLQQVVGETLSQLYGRVILPPSERNEKRGALPPPPQFRDKAANAERAPAIDAEDRQNQDNKDADGGQEIGELSAPSNGADAFLDDRDDPTISPIRDPADDSAARTAEDADDESPAKNASNSPEDDDENDNEPTDTGPTLAWNSDVAATLRNLKQNVAIARQAIKRTRDSHIKYAREDIAQLRDSLSERNASANRLRKSLLIRLREDRAAREQQDAPSMSNETETNDKEPAVDESDLESLDEVAEAEINAILPFRPERLKQLPVVLDDTVAEILQELAVTDKALAKISDDIAELIEGGEKLRPDELFKRLQIEVFVDLPGELNNLAASVLSVTLVQARARTESITLPAVDLDWENAVSMARCNRLDWMNARAGLVDTWRQVQVTANDLESQLDVIVNGDIGNVGDNGLDFRASTGRLRFGLEFDSPITRLAERNNYRGSLINYQRSRRSYYQFEDRVATSLRDILRRLEINQITFELQRAAVDVAISQVELARLRLQEPPRPGEQPNFGATTARDLVSALAGLLSAQNDFLDVWVSQEVLRRSLDLDLGTMQLDGGGLWIDPGPRLGWNENRPYSEELDGQSADDANFGSNPDSEQIKPPLPDEPAKITPLPDGLDVEPIRPNAGPQIDLDADARFSPRRTTFPFRPSPIQPVRYDQPILNADNQ